jgi:diguanylate cyclase (GGDEF)-like protein
MLVAIPIVKETRITADLKSAPRLLLVEPEPGDARLLARKLLRSGFRTERAATLAGARQLLSEESFDIVVASDVLPDGLAAELALEQARVPVVILLDAPGEDRIRGAFAAGALDVLVKDGHLLPLLEVRLSRLVRQQAESRLLREVLDENERLLRCNRMLTELSLKDPLTNVLNRRGFDEAVRREVSRAVRSHEELGLAYFDLDHFKSINDDHGHEAGDAVLRNFAEILRREGRTLDVPARVGGDEFAALLPSADLGGALRYAERVRRRFEECTVPFAQVALATTVSGGAALFSEARGGGQDLLKIADERLYRAKAEGRNRIIAFEM